MTRKKEKPFVGHCRLCEEPVTSDDFCYGCRQHVCVDCDETQPAGTHSVDDHKLAVQGDDFAELDFN